MKNSLLGLGLLLIAIMLIFQQKLNFPTIDIPIWVIICSIVFVTGTILNGLKKDWLGVVGSLSIWSIILNSYYNLLPIDTGSLILAVILLVSGVQLMIKKKS